MATDITCWWIRDGRPGSWSADPRDQFSSVNVVLDFNAAREVCQKIIREDVVYPDSIVRAIVDHKLGIARVRAGNVIHLLTKEPDRAIDILKGTPGIATAYHATLG